MKKSYSIFILVFLHAIVVNAQATFQKSLGGLNAEWGNGVLSLNDGTYIIAGSTNSFGAGNYDFYLIKLSNNGDTLWTKTYGGSANDMGTAVQQTTDGGYIIVGNSATQSAGNTDICLVRTDSSGNLLWAKNYGGAEADEGYAVQQTTDGGFIVAGNTLSISGDGTRDAYLIKTNSLGDTLWTKAVAGIFDEFGYSVLQANDSGYVILGVTTSFGTGTYDIYALKLTSGGFIQWAKAYGGFAFEYGFTIIKTSGGGYAIAGHTSTFGAGDMDMYLLNLGSVGNVLWSKTYGGSDTDVPYSAAQTSDGGFIVAGSTTSFGTGINSDYYLVRTDGSGNLLWSKRYGGINVEECNSVRQTADGGYILNGYTYSFGAGLSELYVIKTDSSGNSGCNDTATATIAGNPFTQTVNFTPPMASGASVSTPVFIAGSGSTVNTLCIVTGNEEMEKENQAFLFPNPATDEFQILNFQFPILNIEIYNVLGEKVYSRKPETSNPKQVTISVSTLIPGMYFVKIKGTNHEQVFKMMKE